MNSLTGPINTKLQHVGTSVFAVMAQIAAEFNALNLSQGFPDFEVSRDLIAKVNTYMKKGYNQYAPLQGVPRLRENIAVKAKKEYGISYDPEKEVNITAGATQAIFTAIASTTGKGDEVIIFEPAYDSYAPSVMLNGGTVKYAQLTCPDYRIDWEQLPGLISNRTRMIIINSPHNPTGSVLAKEFGIASIPLSPFYNKNTDNKILRFCFAKKEETLDKAATILCKI